jgi:hypothetical protein
MIAGTGGRDQATVCPYCSMCPCVQTWCVLVPAAPQLRFETSNPHLHTLSCAPHFPTEYAPNHLPPFQHRLPRTVLCSLIFTPTLFPSPLQIILLPLTAGPLLGSVSLSCLVWVSIHDPFSLLGTLVVHSPLYSPSSGAASKKRCASVDRSRSIKVSICPSALVHTLPLSQF